MDRAQFNIVPELQVCLVRDTCSFEFLEARPVAVLYAVRFRSGLWSAGVPFSVRDLSKPTRHARTRLY